MISDGKFFDTNVFFSGGAGMFIQYYDVVKPVYLYLIIKLLLSKESNPYGLPISIIRNMSILSITEWYIHRRYKNPLQCLDFKHQVDPNDMDQLLRTLLSNDESIYRLSPKLNIGRMMYVYKKNMMTFPVYVYTEEYNPIAENDIQHCFEGVRTIYVHGDLENAIKKCDQNFTYIFSDIELMNSAADILKGSCSHLLLASDYRYNHVDSYKNEKYDMKIMMSTHPFIRTGTTQACDINRLAQSLSKLIKGGPV